MAKGRPTHFKWQHRGSITHSTLYMHSKLVVVGELNNSFFLREMANNGRIRQSLLVQCISVNNANWIRSQ